jgi:hypothetical protein
MVYFAYKRKQMSLSRLSNTIVILMLLFNFGQCSKKTFDGTNIAEIPQNNEKHVATTNYIHGYYGVNWLCYVFMFLYYMIHTAYLVSAVTLDSNALEYTITVLTMYFYTSLSNTIFILLTNLTRILFSFKNLRVQVKKSLYLFILLHSGITMSIYFLLQMYREYSNLNFEITERDYLASEMIIRLFNCPVCIGAFEVVLLAFVSDTRTHMILIIYFY